MSYSVRKPTRSELPALARLWYEGWQVAHAAHVPASLTIIRTLDSFETRLREYYDNMRVIGKVGDPLGFCITKEYEIYQIYVSSKTQGTGAASVLMADGLHRISKAGHKTARLDVIPENARAIAFYEKIGWRQKGIETVMLDTQTAPYPMPCLVMTKKL